MNELLVCTRYSMSKPGTAWSYGYIVWLCAHPNWQREGVASKLIDKVVEAFVEK